MFFFQNRLNKNKMLLVSLDIFIFKVWLYLFFKMFFTWKYIKIIYFFYFFKIIFNINALKWSKNTKKINLKKIKFFKIFLKYKNKQDTSLLLVSGRGKFTILYTETKYNKRLVKGWLVRSGNSPFHSKGFQASL
jgi:hypothetical protein